MAVSAALMNTLHLFFLSIFMTSFFMGGCRKNVILLSPLGGCDLFLDVGDALSRSEYPYGRKLLAIRFPAGQDSQHRGTEDEHLGDEDEYRS